MAKTFTFAGLERGDFVYYLANIVSLRMPAVLVIDNSRSHDLFYSLVGPEDAERSSFEKKNITFLKNASYSESLFEAYDLVLIYQGELLDDAEMSVSDHIYFMPDFLPLSLNLMRKFSVENYENSSVILRDQTSSKISSRSAAALMNVPIDRVKGAILYDFKDYTLYISLAYNGHQSMKGLSPSLTEALTFVAADILNLSSMKEAESLVKKAKKQM